MTERDQLAMAARYVMVWARLAIEGRLHTSKTGISAADAVAYLKAIEAEYDRLDGDTYEAGWAAEMLGEIMQRHQIGGAR